MHDSDHFKATSYGIRRGGRTCAKEKDERGLKRPPLWRSRFELRGKGRAPILGRQRSAAAGGTRPIQKKGRQFLFGGRRHNPLLGWRERLGEKGVSYENRESHSESPIWGNHKDANERLDGV